MDCPQRLSSHTSNEKRIGQTRSLKVLAGESDEQRNANANFRPAFQYSGNALSRGYNWIESKEDYASTSSSLHSCAIRTTICTENSDSSSSPIYNDTMHLGESSDESESELNADIGGVLNSSVNDQSSSLWKNSSALLQTSVSGSVNKQTADRDPMSHKGGRDSCMLNWGVHSMTPSRTRSYEMANKALVSDQSMPYDTASCSISHKFLRKGSSSKAPHIDDITAPLGSEKRCRQKGEDVYQGGRGGPSFNEKRLSFSKNRNAINVSKSMGQSSATSCSNQIAKNKTGFNRHIVRSIDLGQRSKGNVNGSNHRGLSNIMCTSASDVLPSVPTSVSNNLACSSALNILPSSSGSAVGGGDNLCPRKNSRPFGVTEEGETSRGICLDKGFSGNGRVFSEHSPEQHLNPEIEPSPGVRVSAPYLQTGSRHHRIAVSADSMMNVVNTNPVPSWGNRHLPTNYSRANDDRFLRNNDRFESLLWPDNAFYDPIPAYRENLSNRQGSRSSVYGNQHDVSREDSRNRNRHTSTSTSSILSRMHEVQHTRPTFPGPPARPPPRIPFEAFPESGILLPRHATHYSENPHVIPSIPSLNRETNGNDSSDIETMAFGSSIPQGEVRQLLTADTLSEILSALQDIEMDEHLSYEQILMLEATILLGGVHMHDRHRDMRIDIDNMSYEELLALEERIGNVNTGLSEESIMKCIRTVRFVPPDNHISCAPEEIAVKCTVCQEEFEEDVELGVLQCGHSHHIACIKQWLVQKNQCPVCKASVMGD